MTDPAFATAEGLRLLLLDLAYAGRRAWQTSPEAAELMTHTMEKYAGLAHKYGMESTDAAAEVDHRAESRASLLRAQVDAWGSDNGSDFQFKVERAGVTGKRQRGVGCEHGVGVGVVEDGETVPLLRYTASAIFIGFFDMLFEGVCITQADRLDGGQQADGAARERVRAGACFRYLGQCLA